MSDLDHYDVEAMIRDAITRARAEWEADVRNLRDEVNDDLAEVRSDLRGLERTLQSRTEHLA